MPEEFIILESKLNNHSLEELNIIQKNDFTPLARKVFENRNTTDKKLSRCLNKLSEMVALLDSEPEEPKNIKTKKCWLYQYFDSRYNTHEVRVKTFKKVLYVKVNKNLDNAIKECEIFCNDRGFEITTKEDVRNEIRKMRNKALQRQGSAY